MDKEYANSVLVMQFPILKFFAFEHLPENLQKRSRPFRDLAFMMVELNHNNDTEIQEGLRKLLEAKDCFVRAALP